MGNVKYTEEEMNILKACYENPNNEFNYLDFEAWIKAAEEADMIEELLAE